MGELPTTPKEMKNAILRGIRSVLLEQGSATKVEISRSLGISFPTISKFLSYMEKEGEVVAAGLDVSSGGRRAKRYAYNPVHRLGLAVFLEKNETNYTIFNALGENLAQGKSSGVLTDRAESLILHIEQWVAKHPRIRSIAIGVPGAVNQGRIIYIPGYESFQHLDLKGTLEERFKLPVVVENDMNAAVLGYYFAKGSQENRSMAYLYFGQNGPGAGILINGDVVRGSTFFSGEVSFVPQYDDRNFLQALYQGMDGEPGMIHSGGIDAISRLVASFTAIINPHTVIFCHDEVNRSVIDRIAHKCAAYIPEEHLPELTVSDWRKDYLFGLQTLGLELLVSGANG